MAGARDSFQRSPELAPYLTNEKASNLFYLNRARGVAMEHLTYAHLDQGGHRTAWYSVRTFADCLHTTSRKESTFRADYGRLCRLYAKATTPRACLRIARTLYYLAMSEMLAQGFLTKPALALSRDRNLKLSEGMR